MPTDFINQLKVKPKYSIRFTYGPFNVTLFPPSVHTDRCGAKFSNISIDVSDSLPVNTYIVKYCNLKKYLQYY